MATKIKKSTKSGVVKKATKAKTPKPKKQNEVATMRVVLIEKEGGMINTSVDIKGNSCELIHALLGAMDKDKEYKIFMERLCVAILASEGYKPIKKK